MEVFNNNKIIKTAKSNNKITKNESKIKVKTDKKIKVNLKLIKKNYKVYSINNTKIALFSTFTKQHDNMKIMWCLSNGTGVW